MLESLYSHSWGGKWWCCHVWKMLKEYKHGKFVIWKEKCIDCGREMNTILIEW